MVTRLMLVSRFPLSLRMAANMLSDGDDIITEPVVRSREKIEHEFASSTIRFGFKHGS